MKILIIDNYDSFTYNLYQYIGEILNNTQSNIVVKRNDEINIKQINQLSPHKIVISPGPGDPSDLKYFGVCADVLLKLGKKVPVLGVCLGMQGMAHYFGGRVIKANLPMHGKVSEIKHDGKGVFENLPQRLQVMRYHSLVADCENIPQCLSVTATTLDTKEVMGLRHKEFPIEGIQFHPESFATEGGKEMLINFINK
jgi:anthranilate synthase/aminodeoxychorismate synthase-like glutamine amidotransferase